MDNLEKEREQEITLETKACTKLFELAKYYLTKLYDYESFISDLASEEPESLEFLSSSFSLLRELGRLAGRSDGIDSLAANYKTNITRINKNFDVKELDRLFVAEYKGEREWVDELSYIHIWTLNNYQLNLKNNNINDIKTSLNNPELELEFKEAEGEAQAEKQFKKRRGENWTKNSFAVYRNLLNSRFNFGDEDSEYEDGFEQIVSRTQAIERLEREIRGGRIYIYNSKPVRNLKLKRILSYIFLAGLVVSGISFLKTFISSIANSDYANNNQAILFSIMSFIFFLLARNENNKYLDNENFKYSFSRKIFYYYFFLSSFFAFNRADYSVLFQGDDKFQHAMIGVLLCLVISSVTFFTVAFFFLNPKKNKALIKGLLQKYASSQNWYN